MSTDGYFHEYPSYFPNIVPYRGGKFKITFTGGDIQYVRCYRIWEYSAVLSRLDNGVVFESDFKDMAHVEVIG
jgi:hypothetical protein